MEASNLDELKNFLKANLDVLDWKHVDMVGKDPKVSCRSLKMDPKIKPKIQKRQPMSFEKYQASKSEVDK